MLPEGTKCRYDGFEGYIRFSSPEYMTICIRTFEHRRDRDVCVLAYPWNWQNIELIES